MQQICLILIIGYMCLAGFFILMDATFLIYIGILKSRHNTIAKKWGHKIKRYRYMYHFFTPWFLFK